MTPIAKHATRPAMESSSRSTATGLDTSPTERAHKQHMTLGTITLTAGKGPAMWPARSSTFSRRHWPATLDR